MVVVVVAVVPVIVFLWLIPDAVRPGHCYLTTRAMLREKRSFFGPTQL